jgi:hypothetical protein
MIRNPPAAEKKDFPHGFLLSDAAQYAFLCQEVFPDIISFAAAIPDHLKPLFLIPIKVETVQVAASRRIASRIARRNIADGPTPLGDGGEDESEWFGTKTFKYEDNEPTVPSSEPGSIFDTKDGEADSLTHHQEYNFDENIEVPTDTSYIEDVDITQYWDYPYRQKEEPVRHSSWKHVAVLELPWRRRLARMAMKPEELEPRAPEKIKRNSKGCRVSLTSYDKKSRVFTFSVDCGHGHRTVQASLSDIDKVALSCDCPFWRYNGPEFHATHNAYMLGQPFGTASPPDVRDPDRKYFLCKHSYAVLKRLDDFVQEVTEENWDADDDEIMEKVDEDWDRLEGVAEVPTEELEDDDIDIDIDWDEEPEGGLEPEPVEDMVPEPEEEEVFPDYEVDLSELEPDYEPPPAPEHEVPEAESEDFQAVEDALQEPEAEQEGQAPQIEVEDYEVQQEPDEAQEEAQEETQQQEEQDQDQEGQQQQ